jgi:hypothetical protein
MKTVDKEKGKICKGAEVSLFLNPAGIARHSFLLCF